MDLWDVAVIGAGPIGLEVAWALKREGVSCIHFEAGAIGATIGWWAPGTRFFSSPERISICGVPLVTPEQGKATREEYLAYLRGVAGQFALDVRTFTRVVRIERGAEGFGLWTVPSAHGVGGPEEAGEIQRGRGGEAAPTEHAARRVVLAIGDMHRPRELGVEGEDLPHVSHYLGDPHRYFGKRVLIVGGKNSAVEAALRCWRVGAAVTVSYRRERLEAKRVKYWLLPEINALIGAGRIGWEPRSVPVRITPGAVELAPADASGLFAGGAAKSVEADFVLLLTGYRQDPTLHEQLGVQVMGEGKKPVVVRERMETSVPGVYVAGTGAAGTQMGGARLFIENCHEHAEKIAAAITGRRAREVRGVEGPEES